MALHFDEIKEDAEFLRDISEADRRAVAELRERQVREQAEQEREREIRARLRIFRYGDPGYDIYWRRGGLKSGWVGPPPKK